MARLKPGDEAPGFELADQSGNKVRLSAFGGHKVLVYFYPKAGTPVCTRQACAVRDAAPDLERLGLIVLGISPDPPEKQQRFDEKHRLGFPLLSDVKHDVARAYGVWGAKSILGIRYEGTIRSAFVIDEGGKILKASYGVGARETPTLGIKALEG